MKGFASWRRKCVFVRFPTNRSMSDATGEYLYRQMICSVRYGENGDAWTGFDAGGLGDFVEKKELVFAGCLQKFFMYGYCDDF